MKLTAKNFFYAMIVVTLLSFGGIIGAFVWGNGKLHDKATVIAKLKTDTDISQEKILKLQQAQTSKALAVEAEALLANLLPAQKEQEKLLADIMYTTNVEAGIPAAKIGAVTFTGTGEPSDLSGTEESEDISGVYLYPFTMTLSDISYDTLLKLLNELENNDRLVQVKNMQITPDKKVPGQISAVSLSLSAFLMP